MANLLFGAEPLPQVTTSSTSQGQWPKWYQQWINQLMGKASSVAGEPYQAYDQPRIAPFSADTNKAFDLTKSGVGGWLPSFNTGTGMVNASGGDLESGGLDQFMNPYTSGVVDRIGQLAGRNLSENLLPAVNDSFIRAGQFGSSGNQDFTLRALRDTNESALAEQNKALATGYDSAMKNWQDLQSRRLQSGQALGQMGQLGQGLNLQDAAAMQAIGQTQEDKTQSGLNLAYGDFQEQRDYPKSMTEWMAAISHGINPPTSTTSSSTGPATQSQLAPNTLAQIAGTGLGIYGMMNMKGGGKVKIPYKSKQPTGFPTAPTRNAKPVKPISSMGEFKKAA